MKFNDKKKLKIFKIPLLLIFLKLITNSLQTKALKFNAKKIKKI